MTLHLEFAGVLCALSAFRPVLQPPSGAVSLAGLTIWEFGSNASRRSASNLIIINPILMINSVS